MADKVQPGLRRLLPTLTASYGLQAVFALIFVPLQTVKFYDFCGSLGFLCSTAVSLYYPSIKARFLDRTPGEHLPSLLSLSPRQLMMSTALIVWTSRLGLFLLMVG
jgi:hypothetical protein